MINDVCIISKFTDAFGMRRGVLAEIEIRGREFSRHCMEMFSLHEFYLLWAVVLLLVPLPVQVVVQGRVLKGLRSETRNQVGK